MNDLHFSKPDDKLMNDNELAVSGLHNKINDLMIIINDLMIIINELSAQTFSNNGIINKKYITIEEVEEYYGMKSSTQAKFRMNKEIPYVRPAGAKIVLYPVDELDEWMESWRAS